VSATGTWVGTTGTGAFATTVSFALAQAATGLVSGSTTNAGGQGVVESVVGTVNGDTLTLYIGNVCGACTLSTLYRGNISPDDLQLTGVLLAASTSPFVMLKQ
jgi:hypothetical protein